jgi:hypothetical protein
MAVALGCNASVCVRRSRWRADVSTAGQLRCPRATDVVKSLSRRLLDCHDNVLYFERDIIKWHRSNDVSRRLASIPHWAYRR